MKLEFSRQIIENHSNIKFRENPFIGSRVVPCGRTDITKLIVAFRNFTNVPKNGVKKPIGPTFKSAAPPLKMGPIRCPQTLVTKCQPTPHNIPWGIRPQLHGGRRRRRRKIRKKKRKEKKTISKKSLYLSYVTAPKSELSSLTLTTLFPTTYGSSGRWPESFDSYIDGSGVAKYRKTRHAYMYNVTLWHVRPTLLQ